MSETAELLVEQLPRARRVLRVAVVTETYPPDTGALALTAARLIEGLHHREHEIQLVRPRRDLRETTGAAGRLQEILTLGMPVPRRPGLRVGLPATRALARLWGRARPDVVYILTQGPLGWSALRAARALRLPAVSHFNSDFLGHCRGHGAGWLSRRIVAYLRKFHNRALWTLVPSEAIRSELASLGFRNLRVVSGGAAALWWDLRQIETLLEIAAGLGSAASGPPGERGAPVPDAI
jgi:hypothetical protein